MVQCSFHGTKANDRWPERTTNFRGIHQSTNAKGDQPPTPNTRFVRVCLSKLVFRVNNEPFVCKGLAWYHLTGVATCGAPCRERIPEALFTQSRFSAYDSSDVTPCMYPVGPPARCPFTVSFLGEGSPTTED